MWGNIFSVEGQFVPLSFSAFSALTQLMTVCPHIFEISKFWNQPMYVLIVVVDEDDNEDDEGGCRGLGEDGVNARDRCGDCRGAQASTPTGVWAAGCSKSLLKPRDVAQ
jgi:hypothetical protein